MIPDDAFPSVCINEGSDHHNCLIPLTSDHQLAIDNGCIAITEHENIPTTAHPNLYTFRSGAGYNKTSNSDTLSRTLADHIEVRNEVCKGAGPSNRDSSCRIKNDPNLASFCTAVEESSSASVYQSIVGDSTKYVDSSYTKYDVNTNIDGYQGKFGKDCKSGSKDVGEKSKVTGFPKVTCIDNHLVNDYDHANENQVNEDKSHNDNSLKYNCVGDKNAIVVGDKKVSTTTLDCQCTRNMAVVDISRQSTVLTKAQSPSKGVSDDGLTINYLTHKTGSVSIVNEENDTTKDGDGCSKGTNEEVMPSINIDTQLLPPAKLPIPTVLRKSEKDQRETLPKCPTSSRAYTSNVPSVFPILSSDAKQSPSIAYRLQDQQEAHDHFKSEKTTFQLDAISNATPNMCSSDFDPNSNSCIPHSMQQNDYVGLALKQWSVYLGNVLLNFIQKECNNASCSHLNSISDVQRSTKTERDVLPLARRHNLKQLFRDNSRTNKLKAALHTQQPYISAVGHPHCVSPSLSFTGAMSSLTTSEFSPSLTTSSTTSIYGPERNYSTSGTVSNVELKSGTNSSPKVSPRDIKITNAQPNKLLKVQSTASNIIESFKSINNDLTLLTSQSYCPCCHYHNQMAVSNSEASSTTRHHYGYMTKNNIAPSYKSHLQQQHTTCQDEETTSSSLSFGYCAYSTPSFPPFFFSQRGYVSIKRYPYFKSRL